jgi:hypothetical protein
MNSILKFRDLRDLPRPQKKTRSRLIKERNKHVAEFPRPPRPFLAVTDSEEKNKKKYSGGSESRKKVSEVSETIESTENKNVFADTSKNMRYRKVSRYRNFLMLRASTLKFLVESSVRNTVRLIRTELSTLGEQL